MDQSLDYGKRIKIRLIELGLTQKQLTEMVAKKTGKYFDTSYLSKVIRGKLKTPGIVAAINEILGFGSEVVEKG